eukprot:5817039-Prymnesium_polylepis.1
MVASGQQPPGRRQVAQELKVLRPSRRSFLGHPVSLASGSFGVPPGQQPAHPTRLSRAARAKECLE